MTYRTDDIVVSTANPFEHDALDRKPLVKFLSNLIVKLTGPFVMAIDGPWGSGKTTLMHMLKAQLTSDKFQCIEFNAWKVDYVADPLLPLMAEIDKALNFGEDEQEILRKDNWGKAKKITALVVKRTLVAGVKLATAGILDVSEGVEQISTELTGAAAEDIVSAFQKETELLEQLRNALKGAVEGLASRGKKPNLIFFIDELDRCRPDFAIELLERVKHIFDVKNIIFVLLIDKQQLEASTKAIYGAGTNAPEYLRRFIDLEYGLPTLDVEDSLKPITRLLNGKTSTYTKHLISHFKLDEIFDRIPTLRQEKDNFEKFFGFLADAFCLTLRARERCMTRLHVVLDKIWSGSFDYKVLILLVILRTKEPSKFYRIIKGHDAPESAVIFLEVHLKNHELEGLGAELRSYLVMADFDRKRCEERIAQIQAEKENEYNRAFLRVAKVYILCRHTDDRELKSIVRAVDLVGHIR